jgi:protein-tyrosine phosphatase
LLRRFRDAHITPILAHPERSRLFQAEPSLAASWVAAGGLLQITGSSLLGRMGRRAEALAWDLLDAGFVYCVASDAHDAIKRPPDLRPAFRAIYERAGQTVAARLFTHNPARIVHDR